MWRGVPHTPYTTSDSSHPRIGWDHDYSAPLLRKRPL